MAFFATAFALLIVLYYGSFLVKLLRNYLVARKTGFPIILYPIDRNNPIWMVFSIPLRPLFNRYLPAAISSHISLGIYGWDYHDKRRPFRERNSSSYMLVTCGTNELWTVDPEMVADVMKRLDDFPRTEIGNFVLETFGPSVIRSHGEAWVRQRKLITGVINERISKVVFEEAWRQTQAMVRDIHELTTGQLNSRNATTPSGHTEANPAINGLIYSPTFPAMKRIAINVLFRSAYGSPQDFKQSPKADHSETKQGPIIKLDMVQCIQAVISNFAVAALLPKRYLLGWPASLPGAKWANYLGAAVDQFPKHLDERLDEERKALKNLEDGESRSNLMSMMSQALENGTTEQGSMPKTGDNKHQPVLSEDELRGNLFIFTTAGFETTANTLTFALVSLILEPKWQEWLFEEIHALFAREQVTATADGDVIDYVAFYPKAVRCLALMMETLRMYPPIFSLTRGTPQNLPDRTIKSGQKTYCIPAGTHIYSSMNGLHHDPSIWRNLNLSRDQSNNEPIVETIEDALEMTQDEYVFRPSRWINQEVKQMPDGTTTRTLFQPPRGSFIPFIGGPRVCPGQKVAQVEFVCVILGLLREFRLEAVRNTGESDLHVKERLQGVLKDCHAELTLIMDRLHEVEVRFVKRSKT